MKMEAARGGMVRDGNKWNGMLSPKRHMDVQCEAYLRCGINLPAPRETGDVNDAPPCLDGQKVKADVKRHKKLATGSRCECLCSLPEAVIRVKGGNMLT